MEKIKKINPVLVVFLLLGLRVVGLGSDIGTALALTAICGLIGFKEYLVFRKGPDINETVAKELEAIKTYVTGLSVRQMKSEVKTPEFVPGKRMF